MSGQEYSKKIQSCKKQLNALKKDINYRNQMVERNEPTYALDAEIRGQFISIDEDLAVIEQMLLNFQRKGKDLNLTPKQIQKRRQAYTLSVQQKSKLKRMYDESLSIKIAGSLAAKNAQNISNLNQQYKGKIQTKEDLVKLKQQLQKKQDDRIQDLTEIALHLKNGQKITGQQLKEQQVLLNRLEDGIDDNMEHMSKVRKNLGKLLENSSYTCLILVILLQIAGIICNLIFWHK